MMSWAPMEMSTQLPSGGAAPGLVSEGRAGWPAAGRCSGCGAGEGCVAGCLPVINPAARCVGWMGRGRGLGETRD